MANPAEFVIVVDSFLTFLHGLDSSGASGYTSLSSLPEVAELLVNRNMGLADWNSFNRAITACNKAFSFRS